MQVLTVMGLIQLWSLVFVRLAIIARWALLVPVKLHARRAIIVQLDQPLL